MLKKRYYAAAATTALALLLAGCAGGGSETPSGTSTSAAQESSAPPAAADQSKADACQIVQDSFSKFGEVSSNADATDPQAVLDNFKELSTTVGESLNTITNAEVKPAATKAATALSDYVAFLETLIADPSKAADMSDKVTALQEGFTEAATVCAS